MKHHLPSALAGLVIFGFASAVSADLADQIAETRQQIGAPGLAAIVMVDGQVADAAADGLRVTGQAERVTEQDRWHLGSITKSMTATLVARLADRGIVSWNDTVGDVLGGAISDMRPVYRPATFRHLLSHRAGLQSNIAPRSFKTFGQQPADPLVDRLAWTKLALAQEPVGPIGDTFAYANNGYVVAAAMLEARTGKPWEELIHSEVFAPLGLDSAGFGPPGTPGANDAPRGHQRSAGMPRPMGLDVDNPAALSPAGRVHMTLNDLVRFVEVHRRKDATYLRSESFEVLHTPPFGGNYALGWVREPTGMLWHNGSNGLWYAEVAFAPATGAVAAIAANEGDLATVGAPISRLLREVMQITTP